jgi:transposase
MEKTVEKTLTELLLGKGVKIDHIIERDNKFFITAHSTSFMAFCPSCGSVSTTAPVTYERTLQDLPIHLKTTYLKLTVQKYECGNSECDQKIFCEKIFFAQRYQRRTDELNALMTAVSIGQSYQGASTALSKVGIKASDSAFLRFWEKLEVAQDTTGLKFIGVDDVALLCNSTYLTVIYDMETHDMVALLPGRDGESLRKWLLAHPDIVAIARDRDSAYAKVISEVCPDAVQIADRFHLFQNLSDHIWNVMKAGLPESFVFQDGKFSTDNIKKIRTLKISLDSPELDNLPNYDNSPPRDEDCREIQFDLNRRNLDYRLERERLEKRTARQEKIRNVQQDFEAYMEAGWRKKDAFHALSGRYEATIGTLKKYINMTDEEIASISNTKNKEEGKTNLGDYWNTIYKMLKDEIDPGIIFSYILKKGYKGGQSTLHKAIYNISSANFGRKFNHASLYRWKNPEGIVKIGRNDFKAFITGHKKDEATEKLFLEASQKAPLLLELEGIYEEFQRILMGNQRDELDEYLDLHSEGHIAGFVKSIKKDIAPIKNAISFKENSGFVEGGNHKFKLIKRLHYGRLCLDNLFKKCWFAFKVNDEQFSLSEMIMESFI